MKLNTFLAEFFSYGSWWVTGNQYEHQPKLFLSQHIQKLYLARREMHFVLIINNPSLISWPKTVCRDFIFSNKSIVTLNVTLLQFSSRVKKILLYIHTYIHATASIAQTWKVEGKYIRIFSVFQNAAFSQVLFFSFSLSYEWVDWDADQELVQVTLDMRHVFCCVTMCCDSVLWLPRHAASQDDVTRRFCSF